MSVFKDYKKELMDAAHNERIGLALSRAIKSYRANTNRALERFPHTIKMAEEVREIKEKAIGEMRQLAEQACEVIEENKGKAYIADTADDALNIIDRLVGKGKLIVKGTWESSSSRSWGRSRCTFSPRPSMYPRKMWPSFSPRLPARLCRLMT